MLPLITIVSDIISLSLAILLMPQDRSALGMGAIRSTILEYQRDDRAPDDKIRFGILVIYCHWTSSIMQLTNNCIGLWQAAGRLCVEPGRTVKIPKYKVLFCTN